MNSMERKRLEARLRALQFARAEENIMPFSGMKEQVLKACELRPDDKARMNRRERKKAGLPLILRVALAATCLLLGISVYSALAPVPVSNANSFLRRAQLFVGNVLKVDAAVEPPEKMKDISGELPGGEGDIAALKAFQEQYGLTLLRPAQLPAQMTLGEIKASGADDHLAKIEYGYQNRSDTLRITVEELADAGGMGIFAETTEYAAPVGTFYVWGADTGWYAAAIIGGSNVLIRGTMGKDAFLMILDGLREVH